VEAGFCENAGTEHAEAAMYQGKGTAVVRHEDPFQTGRMPDAGAEPDEAILNQSVKATAALKLTRQCTARAYRVKKSRLRSEPWAHETWVA